MHDTVSSEASLVQVYCKTKTAGKDYYVIVSVPKDGKVRDILTKLEQEMPLEAGFKREVYSGQYILHANDGIPLGIVNGKDLVVTDYSPFNNLNDQLLAIFRLASTAFDTHDSPNKPKAEFKDKLNAFESSMVDLSKLDVTKGTNEYGTHYIAKFDIKSNDTQCAIELIRYLDHQLLNYIIRLTIDSDTISIRNTRASPGTCNISYNSGDKKNYSVGVNGVPCDGLPTLSRDVLEGFYNAQVSKEEQNL